jgi:hypothetical protein
MTVAFDYLGEFEFIFKNILGYQKTGSQMGSIDEKKLKSKISCKWMEGLSKIKGDSKNC